MCARRAAHAPSTDSEQLPHKLSYLGWDTLSVRTRGEGDSHACTQKKRPCSCSRQGQGPRLGRNSSKKRTHAPMSHLASEHRRIPPRPTRKARMFVGTSRASTHAETQPPFLQPNEVLGGASSACNSCNIYVSTGVGCTRVHTRTSLAGLGSPHGKTPPESCSHCAPEGCCIDLFAMGITCLVWHPSRQGQANTNNDYWGHRNVAELPYSANTSQL